MLKRFKQTLSTAQQKIKRVSEGVGHDIFSVTMVTLFGADA